MTIQTPFTQGSHQVKPEWIDYNGHMNVGYYHVLFDIAAEPFFEWLGITHEFRQQNNSTTFALEAHLNFLQEVHQGDPLRVETRLLDFDYKRFHYYQEMYHGTDGFLAASHESISAYVDQGKRKTAPMPSAIIERLTQIKAAHDGLERPWQVGHAIGVSAGGSASAG